MSGTGADGSTGERPAENGSTRENPAGARPAEAEAGGARSGSPAARWDARYALAGDAVPPPADVLIGGARWLPSVACAGAAPAEAPRALDLACGRAGNGEWLAARGFAVSAWDVSARAIEAIGTRAASGIRTAAVRDVLARPPEPDTFDIIVVARFLERTICPAIARALRPGGVLYYQTFTAGLANPDYLLGPNELLALFPDLAICSYREPRAVPDPGGGRRSRAEAMLVARRTI